MSRTKIDLRTDRVQYTGSNAATARPLILVEHHLQTKHQIDWDSATYLTCFTVFCQRLTSILESWFTNFEQNATEF